MKKSAKLNKKALEHSRLPVYHLPSTRFKSAHKDCLPSSSCSLLVPKRTWTLFSKIVAVYFERLSRCHLSKGLRHTLQVATWGKRQQMVQAADNMKIIRIRRWRRKIFSRIRALKGYYIYQEIQNAIYMPRAGCMLREHLRGAQAGNSSLSLGYVQAQGEAQRDGEDSQLEDRLLAA